MNNDDKLLKTINIQQFMPGSTPTFIVGPGGGKFHGFSGLGWCKLTGYSTEDLRI
jgi:hypothetical protein